jgi:hypothetical protein
MSADVFVIKTLRFLEFPLIVFHMFREIHISAFAFSSGSLFLGLLLVR